MKRRILLVDDEPQMLRQLARVLEERTPYEIRTESNALEVPGILEQEEFDLIITDLGMPGLDGMEILKLVREKGRFEEVVIVTAFGSLGSVLEAVSNRVFDYLVKPFRKTEIVATVERAMRLQSERREDERVREICGREPYPAAERAFRREYARRWIERTGDDTQVAARRTGLSPEEIAGLLEEPDSEPPKHEE